MKRKNFGNIIGLILHILSILVFVFMIRPNLLNSLCLLIIAYEGYLLYTTWR